MRSFFEFLQVGTVNFLTLLNESAAGIVVSVLPGPLFSIPVVRNSPRTIKGVARRNLSRLLGISTNTKPSNQLQLIIVKRGFGGAIIQVRIIDSEALIAVEAEKE